MGNKYILIGVVIVVILIGGGVYRAYFLPEALVPVMTGKVREVTVVSQKNRWNFTPEAIEAERGDKIIMTIVNEDDYDHGIAIDALGISQRMPANGTIKIEFIVTQEGDFPFYCSVPCGEGEVNGKPRGHFDMIGTLKVRGAETKTP